jgi:hypothetical protein
MIWGFFSFLSNKKGCRGETGAKIQTRLKKNERMAICSNLFWAMGGLEKLFKNCRRPPAPQRNEA